MSKYFPLIILALFIDGLQAGVSFAFWGVGSIVGGVFSWIPIVGPAAAAATFATGTILGIIISVCLTVTFGAALIIFLIYNRVFYPQLLLFSGIEMIPIISNAPTWTGLVIASMIYTYKRKQPATSSEEESEEVSVVEDIEEGEEPVERPHPTFGRRVDGIRAPEATTRPTNNNRLQQKLVA